MRNTERASEIIMMPSFQPEGYSGSSERLSEVCASSEGDVSTILGSPSCWEFGENEVSFSASSMNVCWLEGATAGPRVSFSMPRDAEGFRRLRTVANFMISDGGKEGGWKGCVDF